MCRAKTCWQDPLCISPTSSLQVMFLKRFSTYICLCPFHPKLVYSQTILSCVNCCSSFSFCLPFLWLFPCQSVHASFCSPLPGDNKFLKPRDRHKITPVTMKWWKVDLAKNKIFGYLIQPNLPNHGKERFVAQVSVKSRVRMPLEFLGEVSRHGFPKV